MSEKIRVSCDAFCKNPDESWTCTRVTDIQAPDRSIRVNQGITFRKDRPMWGVDVVKLLDENCGEGK